MEYRSLEVPEHFIFCSCGTLQGFSGEVLQVSLSFIFVMNSILLGVGLAMDAFSVSLVNGLNETGMRGTRMCAIAGVFAFFQALMPMLGWGTVHTMMHWFGFIEELIPWIALFLLLAIGGNMLLEGLRQTKGAEQGAGVGAAALFVQGVATSIDAFSVGFAIAGYDFPQALGCSLLIAATTFVICMAGLHIGRRMGTVLSRYATVLGGVILIAIGVEIFVTG